MKHSIYYFAVGLILFLGFSMVVLASPNRQQQAASVIVTSILYVVIGVVHHQIDHDINFKVVIEYIAVGIFAIASLTFLLLGGLGL